MTTKRFLTTTARTVVLKIIEGHGTATDHDIAAAYIALVADCGAPPASRGLLRTVRRQLVRSGHVTDQGRAPTPFGRTAKLWTRSTLPQGRQVAPTTRADELRQRGDQSHVSSRAHERRAADDQSGRSKRPREH